MAVEIRIPSLGESVSEGVIARWLKESGDVVAVDDPLLELETDKATMEIPAEAAGRLEIVKQAGETVAVGTVVARIADGAGGAAAAKPKAAAPEEPSPPPERKEQGTAPAAKAKEEPPETHDDAPLSPAVRKLVSENDIDPAEVRGTGKGGA
jgi:2-oxoglutarate dehydrogenase E2 component (dihydrolipoamide succinyltransferase)